MVVMAASELYTVPHASFSSYPLVPTVRGYMLMTWCRKIIPIFQHVLSAHAHHCPSIHCPAAISICYMDSLAQFVRRFAGACVVGLADHIERWRMLFGRERGDAGGRFDGGDEEAEADAVLSYTFPCVCLLLGAIASVEW